MMSSTNLPVNVGNPCEMSMLDFARTIIRMTGAKSKVVFKPLPQDDPKLRQPDITLARKILKWEPKVNLEDGLKETISFFAGRTERETRLKRARRG